MDIKIGSPDQLHLGLLFFHVCTVEDLMSLPVVGIETEIPLVLTGQIQLQK